MRKKSKDKTKSQAINTSDAFVAGADMSDREEEILRDIKSKISFQPEELIWRSSYFGTKQIGAVHYRGHFNGQPAVLKIQGVKPDVSEVFMISEFARQNRSKVVRPPLIFHSVPWNDANGYEAIIEEEVKGAKVLQSKQLQPTKNIRKFLSYYQEYRQHSLPKTPWLPKSTVPGQAEVLEKILVNSNKAYPNHPYRLPSDEGLAKQAYTLLEKVYSGVPQEFVHAHLSVEDLIYQGDQVVIFSNLFWKWRYPFYDAIFGYHWFILELSHVEGITPEQVDEERRKWLEEIHSLPWPQENPNNRRLACAALLERAVAGFLLDGFLMDPKVKITKYLVESERAEANRLISELQ